MTTDSFNLSDGVLGPHPDEFYGAVGRIVCVFAVIEQQLSAMRHTLEQVEQDKFTQQPASSQTKVARRLSNDLPAEDGDRVRQFLDRADLLLSKRNGIVHSSVPAQAGGRLWGHRSPRSKTNTGGRSEFVETTVAELKEFVSELSKLAEDFNQVYVVCTSRL